MKNKFIEATPIVTAMRAAGLKDATSPLYDLEIPGNPVPRTVKLNFSATNPDKIFEAMAAQIFMQGWRVGEETKSWEIRQAIGLG